jgi:peptide/nickel transport system ATP-binding protein
MESASCAFDGDPEQRCSAAEPVRHRVGDPANRHWVRCHLYRPPATAAGHALSAEPLEPALPTAQDAPPTDGSRTENKASA